MNIEKAKILDAIIQEFEGNISIKWSDLQKGRFNHIAEYPTIESNICFLRDDKALEDVLHESEKALHMRDKGISIITDPINCGYTSNVLKERKKRFFNNLKWLIGTLITLILIFLPKLKCPNKSTPIEQYQENKLIQKPNEGDNEYSATDSTPITIEKVTKSKIDTLLEDTTITEKDK